MVVDDKVVVATVDFQLHYGAHVHVLVHTHTKLHGYGCIYTLHDYNMANLILLNHIFTLGIHT